MDFCKELRKLGRKNPGFLLSKLESVDFSALELQIMKLRYIDGLLFKQITAETGKTERYVFRVHKNAIKKTVTYFNLADWLRLKGQ